MIQTKLLGQPADTPLEIAVLFQCNAAGAQTTACALGTATNVSGVAGCKSAARTFVSKDVLRNVDRPGDDASGTCYVGLSKTTWKPLCGVPIHVDSRVYLQ